MQTNHKKRIESEEDWFPDNDCLQIQSKEKSKTIPKPALKSIPAPQSINHAKRMARKKVSAEDFTPLSLVNEILDRLSTESHNSVWEEGRSFIDPTAGNGNFLIEVLKRKLNKKHNPLIALSTIYGADIMQDNINECRFRLIKVLYEYVKQHNLPKPNQIAVIKIVKRNIKWTPISKKYPNGSLDYDFAFNDEMSDEDAKKVVEKIRKEKLLEQVQTT